MIRIAVADDHPVVRQGLVAILQDEADFEVVGSAASAEAFLELVARSHPDIALVDLELPAMGGIELIERLATATPATRVLVFTGYDTDELVSAALKAGAKGYVLKGASSDAVAKAVRDVAAGGLVLEPRIAATLLARYGAGKSAAVLTNRERQIVRLIGEGLSNAQIAARLSIAERTVKFHVGSILNKLGAENRAQAIALAAQRKLL